MDPETLAAELNCDPFTPLRLDLLDGHKVDILNTGVCFIARLARYFFRAHSHDAFADDVQVISLRYIASLETVAPAQRG